MRAWVVAVLLAASAATASADGSGDDAGSGSGSDAPTAPVAGPRLHRKRDVGYSHANQFGLSARLAEGLRGIAPYKDTVYCGTTSMDTVTGNAPVCVTRSPIALELEVSYGASRHVDLVAELKLGLEHDFGGSAQIADGPRQVALAPGIRYFFSESHHSKLFTTAQIVFDFTSYTDITGASRGTDVGARNLNGIWFDLAPRYSFYLFAGETLSVVRWLGFELEAGVGFQGRYP